MLQSRGDWCGCTERKTVRKELSIRGISEESDGIKSILVDKGEASNQLRFSGT